MTIDVAYVPIILAFIGGGIVGAIAAALIAVASSRKAYRRGVKWGVKWGQDTCPRIHEWGENTG